jgi:Domain of unknown function (DUF4157)
MPDSGLPIAGAPPQLRRKCADCEEDEAQRLQTKRPEASEAAATEAPGIVHEVLRSPGQPLDVPTRAYFEPRFGYNLSGVRVHTDGRAAASAASIGASAYTAGSNIAFATGRYDPATSLGRSLLAHELAHVVQQHLAHQNGSHSGPSIIQRDADSNDYRQGYQDGLNGDDSHALPRGGDALTDYDEGYAKGHYEFSQKSSSGSAPGPTVTPDSDDYRQGYQDGLNGDDSHAVPRGGEALSDYDQGYAIGHYEFSQKLVSGGTPGPTVTPVPTPAIPAQSDNLPPTQAPPLPQGNLKI